MFGPRHYRGHLSDFRGTPITKPLCAAKKLQDTASFGLVTIVSHGVFRTKPRSFSRQNSFGLNAPRLHSRLESDRNARANDFCQDGPGPAWQANVRPFSCFSRF